MKQIQNKHVDITTNKQQDAKHFYIISCFLNHSMYRRVKPAGVRMETVIVADVVATWQEQPHKFGGPWNSPDFTWLRGTYTDPARKVYHEPGGTMSIIEVGMESHYGVAMDDPALPTVWVP